MLYGYKMGDMPPQADKEKIQIELLLNEDCNLRCTYCYITGKNNKRKMTFETAKQAVDFVLADTYISKAETVIWQLGGGEALMEIDIIDTISDYIKYAMYINNHPWFDSYMFNIGSNGLLFNTPKVQRYIQKNMYHVYIAITIDGTREKHDTSRVFADGSGSYDKVVKNIDLWQKQFPFWKVTKSTYSHADLPYLKDSIINLWNLGITYVMANVVFEDVWEEGDDIIFENQLKELADYALEHELWREKTVRFFAPEIGFPYNDDELESSFCGSGKHMLIIDCEGKIYPCNRFADMSLNNKESLCVGDIYHGLNHDKMRSVLSFSVNTVSNQNCINCEVGMGCAYCAGFNYDAADTPTVFQRATYVCKMHKANIRACEYYWEKFKKMTGLPSKRDGIKLEKKYKSVKNGSMRDGYLIFLLNDNTVPHCSYKANDMMTEKMSGEIFNKGIEYCENTKLTPILLGDTEHLDLTNGHIRIVSSRAKKINHSSLVVFDEDIDELERISTLKSDIDNCILLMTRRQIGNFNSMVDTLKDRYSRINVIIKDLEIWNDQDVLEYKNILHDAVGLVVGEAKKRNYIMLSNLTDLPKLKTMNNCDAGETSFTLAPNGKIYICPAFYFNDPDDYIGTVSDGISIVNRQLLELRYAPICSQCDAYQCKRCKFLNKKLTGEINTPSQIQCKVSHIERNATRDLQLRLRDEGLAPFMEVLPEIDYLDPLQLIVDRPRVMDYDF
jgi:uncharacterized protein